MVILALMVQRHELNLFRKPISGRYVVVAFHKHASDHEHRTVRREHSSTSCRRGAMRRGCTRCVFDTYLLTTFIRLYDAQRSSIGGRRVGRHYTRSGLAM